MRWPRKERLADISAQTRLYPTSSLAPTLRHRSCSVFSLMNRKKPGHKSMLALSSVACLLWATAAHAHGGETHAPTRPVSRRSGNTRPLPVRRAPAEPVRESPVSTVSVGLVLSQEFSLATVAPTPGLQGAPDNHPGHTHAVIAACPPPARCHAGEDHSGGAAGAPESIGANGGGPSLGVKVGLALTPAIAVLVGAGAGLSSGLADLTLGLSFYSSLTNSLGGILVLSASAPTSTASRDKAKVTTLAGSLTAMYQAGSFFIGGGGGISGSIYGDLPRASAPAQPISTRYHGNEPHAPVTPPATAPGTTRGTAQTSARELLRGGGNGFLGVMLTDNFSATASAGLSRFMNEDDSTGWSTDATPLRLAFTSGGLQAAAAFSLISAPEESQNPALPTQPFLGLRLQYIFGTLSNLGILPMAGAR